MKRAVEEARPLGLVALIDKEQLARKLELRVGEVVSHAQQQGFPLPVAYFRGRILWTRQPLTTGSANSPTRCR